MVGDVNKGQHRRRSVGTCNAKRTRRRTRVCPPV